MDDSIASRDDFDSPIWEIRRGAYRFFGYTEEALDDTRDPIKIEAYEYLYRKQKLAIDALKNHIKLLEDRAKRLENRIHKR